MPRITSEHRSANRDQIIAAARRCFARQGFHGTSMPDIAAEAGLSTGAPYRYFSGKQELIVEVARLAFEAVFEPVMRHIEETGTVTADELVAIAVQSRPAAADDELLRCGIAAWSEVLQNADLREHAVSGFTRVTGEIAQALRGTGRRARDAEAEARMIVALLHGFMIQRVAFGRPDLKALPHGARAAITGETP
ncbi:TetR/AcrR family transcriptional regulator [Amycolatopsis saalfeldensis]|uniref:DNA-binding transcriptional regulator, AcrR family n=1 Tax=Amycolatopsis saalfeldensis TaxID=394193 RepID=A0A1H8VHH7_9PSEU|nr:TetR/AcrR family transcriptional regulator [Amycolatopsis saalfeldensis]SEP14876.1 DNA-binding transcriptional regulator, AcrR family [Amycolatopsis saalfeldensis]